MRVLKVIAEGMITSFRYPHFVQQIHPTFLMPPPSTIYGHLCSAIGEWVDPTGLQFAYHFTHQGVATDIEHIIVASAGKGKLPGTGLYTSIEGTITPFERQLLFKPRLILYLNRPEWADYFRSPRYTVVFGRSQDLFTYTSIEVVDLEEATTAYFEHTIAPYEMALKLMRGITITLPRFLDYHNSRTPYFGRYLILKDRVQLDGETVWVDPTSPEYQQRLLGLFFHSFIGENDEIPPDTT